MSESPAPHGTHPNACAASSPWPRATQPSPAPRARARPASRALESPAPAGLRKSHRSYNQTDGPPRRYPPSGPRNECGRPQVQTRNPYFPIGYNRFSAFGREGGYQTRRGQLRNGFTTDVTPVPYVRPPVSRRLIYSIELPVSTWGLHPTPLEE
jgi:hypothetical protein